MTLRRNIYNDAPYDGTGYVREDGQWINAPTFPSINVDYIAFDLTAGHTVAEGELAWNADDGTLDLGMAGGDVTLQIGQEIYIYAKAGEAISNGDAVYASGAVGISSHIEVSKYIADGTLPAHLIVGVATEDIAIGQFGYITSFGNVRGIDTSGWSLGDILYPSPTVAGALTNTQPSPTDLAVPIAFVTTVHAAQGSIITRITPPYTLGELHDVDLASLTTKDLLLYNGGYWHNRTFEEAGIQSQYSGFVDRADSTLSFVDGTRTFTIAPTGASFQYWVNAELQTVSSSDSIVIPDSEGLHFIYYDDTATLMQTQTFVEEIITEYAFVTAIYWDATNSTAIIFADERHGYQMDPSTHLYNHETFGTRYGNGLGLGDMDVDGSGNDASAAQLSVAAGEIWDEDIHISIIDGSPQTLSVPAEIPVFYRSGASGNWRKLAATSYPISTTGTGRAAWNEFTGATWQISEVGNVQYVLMHYYATSDTLDPIIGVMGQNTYASLAGAQAGATVEIRALAFGQLEGLTAEFLPIATVIWQTSNSYSNAVKSRARRTEDGGDYIDWRESQGSGSSAGSSVNDPFAIHDNVANEISAIAAKATPVSGDYLLIEDSAAAGIKKSITMGDIDHDALTNYLADEHIDWTTTSENFFTTGDASVGGVVYADSIQEYTGSAGVLVDEIQIDGSTLRRSINTDLITLMGGNNFLADSYLQVYGSSAPSDANDFVFNVSIASEVLRYDHSESRWDFGNVGVTSDAGTISFGQDAQDTIYNFSSKFSVLDTVSLFDWDTDTSSARLLVTKSRGGGTPGTHGVVLDDDRLFFLAATGSDGTDFDHESAAMAIYVDGTPAGSSVPGRITWLTASAGQQYATERMRLTSEGRLGINTTSPSSAAYLDVVGRIYATNQMHIRGTTIAAALEVGTGRTADGNSYIDLTGDTTYTDYGLRIIRNSGANGGTTITSRGTGGFAIGTNEAGVLLFRTDATERLRIDAAGEVGINDTSPDCALDVTAIGTDKFKRAIACKGPSVSDGWSRMDFFGRNTANTGYNTSGFIYQVGDTFGFRRDAAGTEIQIYTAASDGVIRFFTNGTERLRIAADGGIVLFNLPTSDPGVTGELWDNGGVVNIS